MLRFVTIIFLSITAATVSATPRRPMGPKKCERILVTDDLQEEVGALAREVAELTGDYNLKMTLKNGPDSHVQLRASDERLAEIKILIDEMKALVLEIRANYTKSVDAVNAGVAQLQTLLSANGSTIRYSLEIAPPPPPQPKRFMKREALGPDLQEAGQEEAEQYFRGQAPQHQSQIHSATSLPFPYNRQWPPREKP